MVGPSFLVASVCIACSAVDQTPPPPPPSPPPPPVQTTLTHDGRQHRFTLTHAGRELIRSAPLHTLTACDVKVTRQDQPNGCLLIFDVTNATDKPQNLPSFELDVSMSQKAKWVNPRLMPQLKQGGDLQNHPLDRYPGWCYSPVTGFGEGGVFVGVAMLYDMRAYEHIFNVRGFYRKKAWHSRYTPLGPWPKGKFVPRRLQPRAQLRPGESRRYTLAVGVATIDRWFTAYSAYKRFFHRTWGGVRYQRDLRPIAAISIGTISDLAPDNRQGYRYRLDRRGWQPFANWFMQHLHSRGWQRMMIWQAAGSYRQEHKWTNMVFEIGTGLPPKAAATANHLAALTDRGVTVGFWMGRATSISPGYNSGVRWPLDAQNPEDMALWFAQGDAARAYGVRQIGLDAISKSSATEWLPDVWDLHDHFFPKLYERYPDMLFPLEKAPDLLHVWGPTHVFESHLPRGPGEFCNYLLPGSVVHVSVKRGRLAGDPKKKAHRDPRRIDQLLEWGYVPLVFQSPGDGVFNLTHRPITFDPPIPGLREIK